MKKEFNITSYEKYDKDILVEGPNELRVKVDFDDVDRTSVEKDMKKMIKILNDHWNDPKYAENAHDLFLLSLEKAFVKIFNKVMEDESNGESIDEIEVKMKGKDIIIEYAVDGDDYGIHRGNTVTIKENGKISYGYTEFMESRSGISELEEKFAEWLKTNKK